MSENREKLLAPALKLQHRIVDAPPPPHGHKMCSNQRLCFPANCSTSHITPWQLVTCRWLSSLVASHCCYFHFNQRHCINILIQNFASNCLRGDVKDAAATVGWLICQPSPVSCFQAVTPQAWNMFLHFHICVSLIEWYPTRFNCNAMQFLSRLHWNHFHCEGVHCEITVFFNFTGTSAF